MKLCSIKGQLANISDTLLNLLLTLEQISNKYNYKYKVFDNIIQNNIIDKNRKENKNIKPNLFINNSLFKYLKIIYKIIKMKTLKNLNYLQIQLHKSITNHLILAKIIVKIVTTIEIKYLKILKRNIYYQYSKIKTAILISDSFYKSEDKKYFNSILTKVSKSKIIFIIITNNLYIIINKTPKKLNNLDINCILSTKNNQIVY